MPLLPDPALRERVFARLISVDDHLCEPSDLFENRRTPRFGEAAPHIVEKPDGTQVWVMEGVDYPNIGLNAVVGRPKGSGTSSRPASTRCARGHGMCTPASPTWMWAVSMSRCA